MVGRADFVQLINTYCLDVESILSKLESYIDLQKVDFSKLAALAAEVGERSSRIDENTILMTCVLGWGLRQVHSRYELDALALSWTQHEFTRTREKLRVVVQLRMEYYQIRLEP
ncbi:histidine-containing phosphotransfer protein 1-like protein [Corchorus olitorius]|uniref:Histidine-containing phosphotransfer protein 1-like protein n=1 Tax=Corchorus olitorius TaxID=93759 RepID=A0A1R3J2N7_9ROSI|nr:histidine-containing phosphotransfer protein 1-like protein [Corchorus olitorius]